MTINLCEIKGVTDEIAAALHGQGILDSAQLLVATGRPAARAELAKSLCVDTEVLLGLANRADLARIQGLTAAYIDLMALAGVDTVLELSRRIPENLYAKLVILGTHRRPSQLPHLSEVQRWVCEAKQLERAVFY